MHDLYTLVGIEDGPANEDAVRAHLESSMLSPEKKRIVEYVLLSPNRKAEYDRQLRFQKELDLVRRRLDLPVKTKYYSTRQQTDNDCQEQSQTHRRRKGRKNFKISKIRNGIVAVLVLFFVVYLIDSPDRSTRLITYLLNLPARSTQQPARPTPSPVRSETELASTVPQAQAPVESPELIPVEPAFAAAPLELPPTGAILAGPRKGVAPLTIETSGQSNRNYLIKLVNVMGSDEVIFFVRGSTRASVNVPLGTYRMRYAVGTTWYGLTHFFGPETQFYSANTLLNFQERGTMISGYTITLYAVPGGNLPTASISAAAF